MTESVSVQSLTPDPVRQQLTDLLSAALKQRVRECISTVSDLDFFDDLILYLYMLECLYMFVYNVYVYLPI